MKNYLWILFVVFIFIKPISNVIAFLVNNNFAETNNINEIVYPTRG